MRCLAAAGRALSTVHTGHAHPLWRRVAPSSTARRSTFTTRGAATAVWDATGLSQDELMLKDQCIVVDRDDHVVRSPPPHHAFVGWPPVSEWSCLATAGVIPTRGWEAPRHTQQGVLARW
jgi:hypothetical protein